MSEEGLEKLGQLEVAEAVVFEVGLEERGGAEVECSGRRGGVHQRLQTGARKNKPTLFRSSL